MSDNEDDREAFYAHELPDDILEELEEQAVEYLALNEYRRKYNIYDPSDHLCFDILEPKGRTIH